MSPVTSPPTSPTHAKKPRVVHTTEHQDSANIGLAITYLPAKDGNSAAEVEGVPEGIPYGVECKSVQPEIKLGLGSTWEVKTATCIQEDKPVKQEGNSVKQEEKPVRQDDKLAKQENKPARQDDKPARQDDKPARQDDKPARQDDKPARQDDKPARQDDKPARQDDKPARQDDKPAKQEFVGQSSLLSSISSVGPVKPAPLNTKEQAAAQQDLLPVRIKEEKLDTLCGTRGLERPLVQDSEQGELTGGVWLSVAMVFICLHVGDHRAGPVSFERHNSSVLSLKVHVIVNPPPHLCHQHTLCLPPHTRNGTSISPSPNMCI